MLAAELMAGNHDPHPHAAELLRRALAALPAPARAEAIRLRADAGYFADELARAALLTEVEFAIGARRIAPLWRILDGVAETAWTDAIDTANAQVAVAELELLAGLTTGPVAGRDPAAYPPGPARRVGRAGLRRPAGADAAAPYTPTSRHCRSTSWPTPAPTLSTATRSS